MGEGGNVKKKKRKKYIKVWFDSVRDDAIDRNNGAEVFFLLLLFCFFSSLFVMQ